MQKGKLEEKIKEAQKKYAYLVSKIKIVGKRINILCDRLYKWK